MTDLLADIQLAQSFSENTTTAVTFTVPDRNGDNNPETIRYAWSGNAGDPLTRQYNSGAVVTVAENVHTFHIDSQSLSANLLNNPDMEGGTANWAAHGTANLLEVMSNVHGGSRSILVEGRAAPSDGVEQDITGYVSNGTALDITIWVNRSSPPLNMQLAIKTVSSTNGTQFHTTGSTTADGWTAVSASITPWFSGTLTSAHLVLRSTSGVDSFHIDDASMRLSGSATSRNWLGIQLQVGGDSRSRIDSGANLRNKPF